MAVAAPAKIPTGALLGASAVEAAGSIGASLVSAHSAREQMDFQERMSSTAHQREVEDLIKAGLNPILSADKGASTPPGTMINPENPLKGLTNAVLTNRINASIMDVNSAIAAKTKSEQSLVDTMKIGNQLENRLKMGTVDMYEKNPELRKLRELGTIPGVGANIWEQIKSLWNEHAKPFILRGGEK